MNQLPIHINTLLDIWKSALISPILKGGDPTDVNNNTAISKLCILANALEGLVVAKLHNYLLANNNPFSSGI